MKACPACHRLFPAEGGYCPVDGQRLVSVVEAQVPSDPEDPRVGKALCNGRYQIWRVVADGGMGRVYQALDLKAQRSVALKILHRDVALDDIAVARFRREFELSSSLPHEHIVEVLAFERTEDKSYALVMEYLEGEELRTVLKREKVIPPERVIRMVAHIARGLAAAHDRKVVHRDLKPDNIFLVGTRDGDLVKILDFGSVRDNSEGARKLTAIGTTIGSPFYMSPEQAQGLATLDHRADVWSLAAIIYECLTGTVPFRGPTGPAILLSILTDEPVPPSVAGKAHRIPATLDAVMEEALTKTADARIPTAAALADRLGQAYGLEGGHRDWADQPLEQLAARIEQALPGALARYEESAATRAARPGSHPALMEQAFRAGSEGGPTTAFQEDVVMGVPTPLPRWVVPVVAATAVLVGVIVAILIAR